MDAGREVTARRARPLPGWSRATWAVVLDDLPELRVQRPVAVASRAGTRALFLLGGLVSIAFGVVLLARPGMGAVTLALLFGLFNLVRGVSMLVQGIELRRIRTTLHPVLHDAHAA
jgi:hypothetical protein